MNKKFVITRPDHDLTTDYLSHWGKLIITQAKQKGIDVIDLRRERANRQELEHIILKTKPSFLVLNGHGDDKTVTGYDNKPLIEAGKNDQLLQGTVTYAFSCRSGKKLGRKAVESGTRAYIGYDDDFIFMVDESKHSKPLQDKTAALFFEPSNAVAIALLKGNTASTSSERSKNMFRQNIRKLLTSESPREEKDALPYLVWDMNHQVCLGDQEARI